MAVTLAGGRLRDFTADHSTNAGWLVFPAQTPRVKCIRRLRGVSDWLAILLDDEVNDGKHVEKGFRLIIEAEQLQLHFPHMDEEGFHQYLKRDGWNFFTGAPFTICFTVRAHFKCTKTN